MIDDSAIQALVIRLARPAVEGGHIVERAAILAAGSDSAAIEAWIIAHAGRPEPTEQARAVGLHAATVPAGAPRRFLIPARALAPSAEPLSRDLPRAA